MSTNTDTTTGLRLVRILPSLTDRWAWLRDREDFPTGDEAAFYALPSRSGSGVVLIVPESDPRHHGMWSAYEGCAGVPLPTEGGPYRAWNVDAGTFEDYAPEAPTGPYPELVPGARFSWGTHYAWYRVAEREDGRVLTDRVAHSSSGTGDTAMPPAAAWHDQAGSVSFGILRGHPLTVVPPGGTPDAPEAPAPVFSQEDVDRAREEGARQAREDAERAFESWKSRAVEIAHQYANDNSLCGEFDRCMQEIGLPAREHEVSVRIHVRGSVTLPRGEDVRDVLADMFDNDLRRFLEGSNTDGWAEDVGTEHERQSW